MVKGPEEGGARVKSGNVDRLIARGCKRRSTTTEVSSFTQGDLKAYGTIPNWENTIGEAQQLLESDRLSL